MRAGGEPGRVAGQVVHEGGVLGADGRRGRTPRGRRGSPRPSRPRSVQAEQLGGLVGDHLHGALERRELAAAQAVAEEAGRVRRAAHAVEVGAGVGAAEHGSAVVPQLLAQRPRLGVVVGRHGPQHGAQLVVDHDLDERVERVLAALGRDVAHDPALQALVRLGVRVADDVAAEVGEAAEDAGLLAVRRGLSICGACRGRCSFAMRSGTGRPRIAPQPGSMFSAQKLRKLMFMGTSTGMVSATMRPPASRRGVDASSWRGTRSGRGESTVSTFQLIGRSRRDRHRRRTGRSRRR